ncbi:MAG: hypothetical protein JXR50_05475 [Prolixibacteraceae bacterium]|nr:hypothetical protein [Prolixibacteraceae bacterium]MBN2649176.1 hypothetical protein [Prolixibacteraceae bacterium]
MKRIIIQILLIAAAAYIGYKIWDSIQTPITFDKERKARYDEVVERLKDIRDAQVAFEDVHGYYSGDWDSLINFVKYDSIPKIRKIGMLTDSMMEAGLNEKTAMLKGLIIRDTIRVNVLNEVFDENYPIDDLKYIPNSGGEVFWLRQTIITTGSGIKVPVFEARAHNNFILAELKEDYEQEIINLNERNRKNGRYPGLRVGSIEEPTNNAGNWE